MFLMNNRRHFRFTERRHSKKGFISWMVSLFILAFYGVILLQAFRTNGMLSTYYGSAGICATLVAVWMLVLAIQSLMEEDSYPLFPRLALVTSIIATLCWIVTYAVGLGLIG